MLKMKDRQTRSITCLNGFSEEANQNNEIDLLLKTIIQFFFLETKECINLHNEWAKDVAKKK